MAADLNPAGLIDDTIKVFKRYVWLRREYEYLACGLWVPHTHAIEAANSTPYIWIFAPGESCGKTQASEVLECVANDAHLIVDPSASSLFRSLEAEQLSTMVIDEVDEIFKPGKEDGQNALRSILNAGYRRGNYVLRSIRQGDNWVAKSFPTFCPKVLNGVGEVLPRTTRSRAIPVLMYLRPPDVSLERFIKPRVYAELAPLRDRWKVWAEAAVPVLKEADPFLPDGLGDRQAEVWTPLFAIADLAGPEFGQRARKAAVELHRKVAEAETVDKLFLRHVHDAFDKRQADRLASVQVYKELVTREDDDGAPWTIWWRTWESFEYLSDSQKRGRMISIGRGFARLLKNYGIKADRIDIDGKTHMGFKREWFEDAWRSYQA